jgi:hypothetical protein
MLLKNRIQMMIGNIYMYRGNNHKVITTRIMDDKILISTDKDLISLDEDEAERIIMEEFLPVSNGKAIDHNLVVYEQVKKLDLAAVLMDNIEKIKADPGYVRQAAAINSTVKTLLYAVNTELMVKKLR